VIGNGETQLEKQVYKRDDKPGANSDEAIDSRKSPNKPPMGQKGGAGSQNCGDLDWEWPRRE